MPLEWTSNEVEVLLNPRLRRRLELEAKLRALPKFEGHVWLATSGTRKEKFVALSKQALLESAQAVNRHLHATSKDVWFNPLPTFHVGGLGIWARAHLSRSGVAVYPDVTQQRWDVKRFYKALCDSGATLTSLVPAQIYDIVIEQLEAPPSLRAVLVGGGYLTETLQRRARELGWPIAPTYGMTECCSQIATAEPGERRLKLLDHVEASTDSAGILRLKSPALLTAFGYETAESIMIVDPKQAGWYLTNDLVTIQDNYLEVLGRNDDIVKIGGEKVLITALEHKLQELMHQANIREGLVLISGQDERLGYIIEAMAEESLKKATIEKIVNAFNEEVMPYERIRSIKWVGSIPRTILGKMIKRAEV